MKKWVIILIVLFILGVVTAFLVYKYVYNKPHPDYEKEKPEFTLDAKLLYDQYKNDKVASQSKYSGKVIQITGNLNKIEDRDSTTIAVFTFSQGDFGDEGIRCTVLPKFNTELKKVKSGDLINIKGYCTGYNDTDVIFEKCSIIK